MDKRPTAHPENVAGDFYVELGCCVTCGIPLECAPRSFVWSQETPEIPVHCVVKRQPATPSEIDDVLEAMRCAEIDCIRYRGTDAGLRKRIRKLGLAASCDPAPKAK